MCTLDIILLQYIKRFGEIQKSPFCFLKIHIHEEHFMIMSHQKCTTSALVDSISYINQILLIICALFFSVSFMQSTRQNNNYPFPEWLEALYLVDTMLICRCQQYGNDDPEDPCTHTQKNTT